VSGSSMCSSMMARAWRTTASSLEGADIAVIRCSVCAAAAAEKQVLCHFTGELGIGVPPDPRDHQSRMADAPAQVIRAPLRTYS